MSATVISSSRPSQGIKIQCKKLTDNINFKCRAESLYQALTIQNMVCAFTRDAAQVDGEKGGLFSLFGGNIHGEFTKLVSRNKIVFTNYYYEWL